MFRYRPSPALLLALAASLTIPAHADKPRKVPPPLAADKYPFHETHVNEHVTIAAEPCDSKDNLPNTRLDYFHHGFLPIRVIVTNDSDQAVTLDDARILFVPADNGASNAATDDELQRRLFSRKSAQGKTIPMPPPIPSIHLHHDPVDKQILEDADDFGFKTTTVAPHTTAAGFLYYDVRNVDDPVLDRATLEVRKVRFASTNKSLDTFLIAMKPTPEKPSAKPAEKH